MFNEDRPTVCGSNHSGLPREAEGREGPAGGTAVPAGSPSDPLGRTKDGEPLSISQSAGEQLPPATPAGADGSPHSPPVSALTHGAPAGGVTFSGVPVRAMEDVMAARYDQIVRYGHTPEKDRETALYSARRYGPNGQPSLLHQISQRLAAATEYASRGHGAHDIARRQLVTTAALCLAAIDWIDAELEELAEAPAPNEDDHL